jgi:hypothetical protein
MYPILGLTVNSNLDAEDIIYLLFFGQKRDLDLFTAVRFTFRSCGVESVAQVGVAKASK